MRFHLTRRALLKGGALLALCLGLAVLVLLRGGSAPHAARAAPFFYQRDLVQFVQVTGGGYGHTCGRTTGGAVQCWGNNESGQLGDGEGGQYDDRSTVPVDVAGLATGVQDISAGDNHTCAVTAGGGVQCWGDNDYGQLGDGSDVDQPAPVGVAGLATGVRAVAAGSTHTCALTAAGGVKCWGGNGWGQLGDGTTTDPSAPVDVVGLASGVQAIWAGQSHTCALTAAGGLKCWGNNVSVQLGDGTTEPFRATPVDVVGLTSGVQSAAAHTDHTCAVTTGGGLKCWGYNETGQLGNGTTEASLAPTDVTGLTSGIQAIAAGRDHTCALTTGGGVKCWGANVQGQLGDGTNTDRLTPADVVGLGSGVQMIDTGAWHTCAATDSGGAKCWGSNDHGQLGNGAMTSQSNTPVDVVRIPSPPTATPTTTPTTTPTNTRTPTATSTRPVTVDTPTVQPTPTSTPVPNGAAETVNPGQPANFSHSSGGRTYTVDAPAGAVDQPTTLVLQEAPPPSAPLGFAGVAFRLQAVRNGETLPGFTFQQPVRLTLAYRDEDVAGLDESTLAVVYDHAASATWRTDGVTVVARRPAQNEIEVEIAHLTHFALAAQQSGQNKVFLPAVRP